MKARKVTPQDFLIITNPEDMKKPNARLMAASYAARFRRKKRQRPVCTQPGAALDSFLLWRFGNLGVKSDRQKETKISRQQEEIIFQQYMAKAERLTLDIPAGLKPRISLQQCEWICSYGVILFNAHYATEIIYGLGLTTFLQISKQIHPYASQCKLCWIAPVPQPLYSSSPLI